MEKGQHGYMNRHKRNVLISIIVLGLFVIAGVFFTVVMFDTRKSIFIAVSYTHLTLPTKLEV